MKYKIKRFLFANCYQKQFSMFVAVIALLFLSSCTSPSPYPDTISPTDSSSLYSNAVKTSVQLLSNGGNWLNQASTLPNNTWVNTNVTLQPNDSWNMMVSGTSSYCVANNQTLTVSSVPSGGGPNPGLKTISINKSQYVTVTINGTANCSTGQNCYCPLPSCASTMTNGVELSIFQDNVLIKAPTLAFPTLSSFISPSLIANGTYNNTSISSLLNGMQYMFYVSGGSNASSTSQSTIGFSVPENGTGGYSLNIETFDPWCYVVNGVGSSSNNKVGSVEYIISPSQPNSSQSGAVISSTTTDATSGAKFAYASGASSKTGNLWVRLVGSPASLTLYNLDINKISAQNSYGSIGAALNSVLNMVTSAVQDSAQILYSSFITYDTASGEPLMVVTIKAMLTIYIIIYAIYFLFGMVQVTQLDLVIRVVKIAVILTLISANSFSFFNTYLFALFQSGAQTIIMFILGVDPSTPAGVFGFVDDMFAQFFDPLIWLKMSASMSELVGIFIMIVFVYAVFKHIFVIAEAFIGYMMSLVVVLFLISIAPLFISLLLFDKTKEYFKKWIGYLLNFALQPVIAFCFLVILNNLVMISFSNLTNFTVHWGCSFPVNLNFLPLLGSVFGDLTGNLSIPIFCVNWYLLQNFSILSLFINLFMFLLYVSLFKTAMDIAPEITSFITGTTGAPATTGNGSLARNVASSAEEKTVMAIQSAKKMAAQALGIDKESITNRKVSKEMNKEKTPENKNNDNNTANVASTGAKVLDSSSNNNNKDSNQGGAKPSQPDQPKAQNPADQANAQKPADQEKKGNPSDQPNAQKLEDLPKK